MSDIKETKKLGVMSIVLMIFSVIFGFTNPAIAFFRMGYASIIWYIFGAVIFFLPFMFISAEFAVSFKNDNGGGIYTWMRRSRGELYGFVGTFMWYFAIVIWLVGMSARTWVPLSSFVFGEDKTKTFTILNFNSTQTLGILGILLIVGITFLATKGFNKVAVIAKLGGISCTLINAFFFIVSLTILILNKGFFEEPIKGASTFLNSPNPSHTMITLFGFITFAVFAYGGIEGLGSVVEKAKSAKTFSKACICGTAVIAAGYSLAIFLWGITANYDKMSSTGVNFGNVLYLFMQNLGYKLGISIGMNVESATNLGNIFIRVVGISMLLCFCGALFTLIYTPLKTLIDGSPKGLWPEFFTKKNKANMPQNAMWLQATIVCTIIFLISFLGNAVESFFEILTLLANVAQTIPYIFITFSFPAFRKNDELSHEYTVFKSKSTAIAVSLTSTLILVLSLIFTIFEPVLSKNPDGTLSNPKGVFNTSCMLIGPLVFFLIAFLIFNSYKKRSENNTFDKN